MIPAQFPTKGYLKGKKNNQHVTISQRFVVEFDCARGILVNRLVAHHHIIAFSNHDGIGLQPLATQRIISLESVVNYHL